MTSKIQALVETLTQFENELKQTVISLAGDQEDIAVSIGRIREAIGSAPGQVDRESIEALEQSLKQVQKAGASAAEAMEFINKVIDEL
jgi:inorganic triphosphatase YgiF